jgi:hypothetical protein
VAVEGDAVHYVAAPGEVNDTVIGHEDAHTIYVRDAGATISTGSGCTALDAHQARCVATGPLSFARVETGDMNDRIRTLGDPSPVPDAALIANGGPGDDELIGGNAGDSLDGGGGTDRLLGAAGADTLTDGDTSGHANADVLVGGPEVDTVVYASRTAPLDLNLGDELTHGEQGEGDSLTSIENIVSGSGADLLTGDKLANDLAGGRGADRLRGGLGDDRLRGGPGADSIFCGGGSDVAYADRRADFIAPDCETLVYESSLFSYRARPYPVAARAAAVRFRLGCPKFGDPSKAGPCSGKLTLRETRAGSHLLGSGRISQRRSAGAVKVGLTAAGRRLARTRSGVLATVTLKGKRLPGIGWTIRLRVPR